MFSLVLFRCTFEAWRILEVLFFFGTLMLFFGDVEWFHSGWIYVEWLQKLFDPFFNSGLLPFGLIITFFSLTCCLKQIVKHDHLTSFLCLVT